MLPVNLEKALEIHKAEIRKVRQTVFPDLDVQFMRALETGNTEKAAEIGAKKEALRNATDISLDNVSNINQLKDTWPTELLGDHPYKK
jgi:hypothetical protein